ncbi:methyltransferase domain-containing protein [Streptomyces anulatus]|uniref:protein-L-isoaspartate(D-aspartate) O-methyltransferase n=1 Tax=Streptomyces anulatus TaxID=1892 RepID=UPI003666BBA8
MDWATHASHLADSVTRHDSQWYGPLATVPRHLFVPRWWEKQQKGWELRDGAADAERWMQAAYSDRTLVTRIGSRHADRAEIGDVATEGLPTSSSTLPSLVVSMYRHAHIDDESEVLVTTGSGYGTALMCRRLGGDSRVTSVDIDPHLVQEAEQRLNSIGLRPTIAAADITGPLGTYDRIISTVSVRPVPASWLEALRPGGRLVTTIAGTGLVLTADKTADGGASGRIEPDPAGFMKTRQGEDYEYPPPSAWHLAQHEDAQEVSTCRYPLLYPPDSWEVYSMLALSLPGISYRQETEGDVRTVLMLHTDGSWARATTTGFLDSPIVHQSGPTRLWSELQRIRNRLNREGALPVYGARVTITPDGETTLSRGSWSHTL